MTEEDGRIRVILVDDHEVVRRGLRGFLELQDDIDVVGEASDGAIAVELAAREHPDVILMDLLMPNMDGLTAISRIKEAQPEIEIVAVTSFIEEEKVTSALEAGASGYLLKDADAEEVAQAVRAAHAGEVHLDPAVARLLAQRMRSRRDRGAVELVETRDPDVMVLDPRLRDLAAGMALVSRLHLDWPALRVVLMGWSDDGVMADGAHAFIAKSAQPEEFVAATLAACNC